MSFNRTDPPKDRDFPRYDTVTISGREYDEIASLRTQLAEAVALLRRFDNVASQAAIDASAFLARFDGKAGV